jgi:hypothetical protein
VVFHAHAMITLVYGSGSALSAQNCYVPTINGFFPSHSALHGLILVWEKTSFNNLRIYLQMITLYV